MRFLRGLLLSGGEEGIEASRKGGKAKRKAGKHPQITQITQIFLEEFKKRKKVKIRKFTWIDRMYKIRV